MQWSDVLWFYHVAHSALGSPAQRATRIALQIPSICDNINLDGLFGVESGVIHIWILNIIPSESEISRMSGSSYRLHTICPTRNRPPNAQFGKGNCFKSWWSDR